MPDEHVAPAYYPLSEENHSGLVVIASITFLIYAVAALITKSILRHRPGSIHDYDIAQTTAGILYFVETVIVVVACNHGLGQHEAALPSSSIDITRKCLYASYILATVVDGLVKLSICLLIRKLYNDGKLRVANYALGTVIAAWMLAGVFATAFQCSLPTPWLQDRDHECSGEGPVFLFNGVMRILIDICLCMMPVALVWRLTTPANTRQIVIVLFGTRIIAPITLIPSLVYTKFLFDNNSDATWRAVTMMVWYQISLGLSVLTACIPGMRRVINSYLGSTSVATIRSPYGLQDSVKSKSSWLQAFNNSGSKRSGSKKSGSATSKPSKSKWRASFTQSSGESTSAAGEGSNKGVKRLGPQADAAPAAEANESALELTEGVRVVRDFQMTDERRESHSTKESGPPIHDPYYSFP